jgi:flagellar biosynthesis/type III secretory pathway M-ring protein FliF/YscJ
MSSQPRPITALDAFQLMLIGLKLAEVGQVATWSWWQVLTPMWVYVVLLIVVKFFVRVTTKAAEKKAADIARREQIRRSFR